MRYLEHRPFTDHDMPVLPFHALVDDPGCRFLIPASCLADLPTQPVVQFFARPLARQRR
ncbi:hypothetical protein ACWCQQ_40300 [Streptomyces sp. NPDC002143]